MARARNKDDLLKFATENYSKLIDIISKMTENQMNTLFDFSGDKSKNLADLKGKIQFADGYDYKAMRSS